MIKNLRAELIGHQLYEVSGYILTEHVTFKLQKQMSVISAEEALNQCKTTGQWKITETINH